MEINWQTFWTMINSLGTPLIVFSSAITAIFTAIMAIAVAVTAVFALITWRESLRKNKYDLSSQLFKEFVELHREFFEKITNREYTTKADLRNISPTYSREAYRLVLFLSKIGNFLSKKIITREEVRIFFWSYLGYKNGLIRLFKNLYIWQDWLLRDVKEDIEFLLDELSILSNDYEFKTLISKFTIKNKRNDI